MDIWASALSVVGDASIIPGVGGHMKGFARILSAATLAAAISTTAAAQWPSFVRKDVPRTSDGKPDLGAASPRMADGKPDLSGLWENAPIGSGGGQRGGPPRPAAGEPPLA